MKYAVLIVDDDKLVNEFLTETLTRAGYKCVSAFSGEEAITRFKAQTFDIVLTDLKMREMDGLTLAALVHEQYPNTHIIMLTAFGSEVLNDSTPNPAQLVLEKPIDIKHIREAALSALASRS